MPPHQPPHERQPGIRPRPSFWRRLDALARRAVPSGFALGAVLLLSAPLGLPGQAELLPGVVLASVFFWSVFRPASMPPSVVFAIGLLYDLLGFTPPGIAILTLLIAHGLGMSWRHDLARQGFVLVWLVFTVVAAGAAALQWALMSAFSARLLPPQPAVFQFALAAGIYPLLAALFTWAHRTVADPARA